YYHKALAIFRALDRQEPPNYLVKRGLAVCHLKTGNLCFLQLGDLPAARKSYQEALRLFEPLAQAARKHEQVAAQRDLAAAYDGLGTVSLSLGEAAKARDYFRKALAIFRARALADPHTAQDVWDLATGHTKVGQASLALGDAAAAR